MKANELRVGNFVKVNKDGLCIKKDTIVEIRAVDADNELFERGLKGCATCLNPKNHFEYGGIWVDYLSPLSLTDEILEKNGFVFVDGYGCMRWMDEEGSRNGGREVLWSQLTRVLQIRAEGVCLDFFGCYCFHELQNILTVLKIGKEIKP